jgi:hypothetical protein
VILPQPMKLRVVPATMLPPSPQAAAAPCVRVPPCCVCMFTNAVLVLTASTRAVTSAAAAANTPCPGTSRRRSMQKFALLCVGDCHVKRTGTQSFKSESIDLGASIVCCSPLLSHRDNHKRLLSCNTVTTQDPAIDSTQSCALVVACICALCATP